MANNVALPGAGMVVATDDVGGVHFQRIKLNVGAEDQDVPVVHSHGLIPVGNHVVALSNTRVGPKSGNDYWEIDIPVGVRSLQYNRYNSVGSTNAMSPFVWGSKNSGQRWHGLTYKYFYEHSSPANWNGGYGEGYTNNLGGSGPDFSFTCDVSGYQKIRIYNGDGQSSGVTIVENCTLSWEPFETNVSTGGLSVASAMSGNWNDPRTYPMGAHRYDSEQLASYNNDWGGPVMADPNGKLVIMPYAPLSAAKSGKVSAIADTNPHDFVTASGTSGWSTALTNLSWSNLSATATVVTIRSKTTPTHMWEIAMPGNFADNIVFPTPIRSVANEVIEMICSAAANVYMSAKGYVTRAP